MSSGMCEKASNGQTGLECCHGGIPSPLATAAQLFFPGFFWFSSEIRTNRNSILAMVGQSPRRLSIPTLSFPFLENPDASVAHAEIIARHADPNIRPPYYPAGRFFFVWQMLLRNDVYECPSPEFDACIRAMNCFFSWRTVTPILMPVPNRHPVLSVICVKVKLPCITIYTQK